MDAKHQFKYTYNEGCEDFSPVEVTFDIPGEVTISQMLYNFESYLKACGFVFDGHLEIVDEALDNIDTADEVYGCMADWDKNENIQPSDSDGWCNDDCGCNTTSSPLETSKWVKAEKKVKEFNEALAKLNNEQLQKAMEEAYKMSGLHYEAIKDEVKKNNWVHGICNPPSKDWKATN